MLSRLNYLHVDYDVHCHERSDIDISWFLYFARYRTLMTENYQFTFRCHGIKHSWAIVDLRHVLSYNTLITMFYCKKWYVFIFELVKPMHDPLPRWCHMFPCTCMCTHRGTPRLCVAGENWYLWVAPGVAGSLGLSAASGHSRANQVEARRHHASHSTFKGNILSPEQQKIVLGFDMLGLGIFKWGPHTDLAHFPDHHEVSTRKSAVMSCCCGGLSY